MRIGEYFKMNRAKKSILLSVVLALLVVVLVAAERSQHVRVLSMLAPIDAVRVTALDAASANIFETLDVGRLQFGLPPYIKHQAVIERITPAGIQLDLIRWQRGSIYLFPIRQNDGLTWEWKSLLAEGDLTYAQRVAKVYRFSTKEFNVWGSRSELRAFEGRRSAAILFRDRSVQQVEVYDKGNTSATLLISKRSLAKIKIWCDVVKDDRELVAAIVEGDDFEELHEVARIIVQTLKILKEE
jgi:hypothetical protein